jgi:hypothetical protein
MQTSTTTTTMMMMMMIKTFGNYDSHMQHNLNFHKKKLFFSFYEDKTLSTRRRLEDPGRKKFKLYVVCYVYEKMMTHVMSKPNVAT